MDKEILRDMSYGMFVLTTSYKGRDVGCFVNTVVQITSASMIVAVSVNKSNYTNQAIKESKKLAISVLSQDTNPEVIGKFGFLSSKEVDKFQGFEFIRESGLPIVNEKICGYMICELVDVVSVDTHDIFIAKIVDCKKVNNLTPMTYEYYHRVIKGGAPKTAPTYVEEKQEGETNTKKYKCIVCGHIYDEGKEGVKFEDLPEDWECPLCGMSKEYFKPIN